MKNNIIYKIVLALCFGFFMLTASAQQVNTLCFMENVPVRSYLNPAFQPLSNFYLGFPVMGYTQFGVGTNSLSIKDLAYTKNGKTISFLHPEGDKDKFYNAIRSTTLLGASVQLNLLDFGFRIGKAYWSFSLTEKLDARAGVPKDFMKLLLYGTPQLENNRYDLRNFGADVTAYTEAAFGYARVINDQWSVGGKLKFLYGSANISLTNDNLDMTAGFDQWTLKGKGVVNASSAGIIEGDSLKNLSFEKPASGADWAKPAGKGVGIDVGATYIPIENLTLSAAITDFGFIRWTKNAKNIDYSIDYAFNGAGTVDVNDVSSSTITDSLWNALEDATSLKTATNAYTTYTTAKLNVAGEYAFYKNKLSVGLLSRTMLHKKTVYEEITASVNGRPIDWFNMSLSYSVMNGRFSNMGAGMGIRTGFLHWFLSADYVPLNWAPLNSFKVPYNTKGVNLAFGVNFVFGNKKDADKDGVVDRKDKCPGTPFGVFVDKRGCPVDADADGVPDYLDKCPNTPFEAYTKIDSLGCPLDTDADGVPDYLDKCLDTPKAAIGYVDSVGCSLDTDKDGVYDYLDKCPNTPATAQVDSVGCPVDTDGDKVPDYLDLCPNTPSQAYGLVDKNGCPLDTDADGVADYLDLCAGTPIEARAFVDKNGCSLDTDDDGVADYLDKCPNTSKEARGMVDEKGCPRDTDSDGVADYLDNCPKIPGTVSNKGCPEVKTEVKKLFQKALQGIQFETGKSVIKKSSNLILNQIAKVLIENSTYLIEIQGHTDNVGKPALNLLLSEKRAAAVKAYLLEKGLSEKRISSQGYGDTKPVSTNKTSTGRAKNRRVEFVVTFEEISIQ